jgi:hypothetical protein
VAIGTSITLRWLFSCSMAPCLAGLSERQQPVKHSGVSASHFDDLRPACCPRHQSYRLAADTERIGDRG